MSDVIRIGGRSTSMTEAKGWVSEYFTPENQSLRNPYAHPAYDGYDSGSGPSELNDGDLLAPALLNAPPTVRAFYSLQRVRPQLTEALANIPVDLPLQDANAAGTLPALLGSTGVHAETPRRPGLEDRQTGSRGRHRRHSGLISEPAREMSR